MKALAFAIAIHCGSLHAQETLKEGAFGKNAISENTAPQTSEQLIRFAIEPQRAHEALIKFANQANLTVAFPFEDLKEVSTNSLHGTYSVKDGVRKLLAHTHLKATVDNAGQITILTTTPVNEDKESDIWDSLSSFFQSDEKKVITLSPPQTASDIERIIVHGLRASVRESVDIKRDSDLVMDAIQAIEMGKFPEQNLAESIQRISGVSIDRSEGEGQFVTVRGFGPEFNTVLINGRQMATDNLGRAFSFDVLSSDMVAGVKVYKTHGANMLSGGIGSTIDIQMAKPLASPDLSFIGSIQGQYDTNSDTYSPQYAMLFNHKNQANTLGLLVSYSEQRRDARIDEAQIDGWLLNTDVPEGELENSADRLFVPRNYDQRVRFDERKRRGGTLVLQYRPDDFTDVTLDYVRAELDVKTDATSMGHWFTSNNLENVVTDEQGTAVEFSQNIGHATDFHARTFDRPTTLDAYGVNLHWQANERLQIKLDWSTSKASIKDIDGNANSLSLLGYLNRSHFNHTGGNILPTIDEFESASDNIQGADGSLSSVFHYLDPANNRAHVMLKRGWNIQDRINQFRFDTTLDGNLSGITQVNFGLRWAQQNKSNERRDNEANARHCEFCGYFATPDIPDNFQQIFNAGGDFLSGISGHQNIPKSWLRHGGEQLFAFLSSQTDASLEAVTRDNSFEVEENVLAAYLEIIRNDNIWDRDLISTWGLRFERTDVEVFGFEEALQSLVILDQTELGQVTGESIPVRKQNHYQNWLPSINFRLEISEDLLGRLSASKTLTRPTITQLSPGITFNTTRQGGDLRASAGNPQLRPFASSNIDLALEYYYANGNLISASYFWKDVSNFIVSEVQSHSFTGVTDPSTGTDPNAPDEQDAPAIFDLTLPNNGEQAKVRGLELSLQHHFGDSGFGILANMTLVNSNAELDPLESEKTFALTGLSNSENAMLFYEQGPWQIRLAYNHRDGFLQSLVQKQSAEPTFVAPYHQWDISASYQINDNMSLFFEGINLTEEFLWKHGRFKNQLLLVQDTGSRYSLGIRGSF